MSVLLTCTGKRYDIVWSFVKAVERTGYAGKVVAVDGNSLSPAQYAADIQRSVPPVADPDYLPTLYKLCDEFAVKAVVPLTDLDIELLASARESFARLGATAFVPPAEVAQATFDKYLAHQFFLERDLPSPPTHLPGQPTGEADFPVLVKPRKGSGGRNIFSAADADQMKFFVQYVDEPTMVQQKMDGPEFSIDILCDLDGNCINAIPRTMLESRGGESIKGATVHDDELIELGRKVGESLPCYGPATVQVFRDPKLGLAITDVNCRFGGAFPAPVYAGGRYPELIVRMAYGEEVEPHLGQFQPDRWFSRYFWQIELEDHDGTLRPTGR